MRLIDTQTHLLLEPWKAASKEYAILSHAWGDQEVIFQEWEQLYPSGAIKGQCPHVRHHGIDQKAGYHKVMQACEQAQRDGIRYLWCDTMCINKESSAELSEAINSMFKWYRDAKVCYVYLTDVTFPSKKTRHGVNPTHSSVHGWFSYATDHRQHDDIREMHSRIWASRWWTRGWTLQELLAPKKVVFFTQDWILLGHKSGIAQWISAMTRIHRKALEDPATIKDFSVAQRMSWAADRQTTVLEDQAYCLLGIFNVNMPMLYGQGGAAFQKLQHEIIKASDDQSIFAWSAEHNESNPWTGALAQSPRFFKNCGSIVGDPQSRHEPYSLTNAGFKMRVPIIRNEFRSQFFIGLACFLDLRGELCLSRNGVVNKSRRMIQIWIPVRKRFDNGSFDRFHAPTSHVYFQQSYPSNTVVDTSDIFLREFPYRTSSDNQTHEIAGIDGTTKTGIAVTVGFGDMSIISKAYRDFWPPRMFQTIPVGSREPCQVSHVVISSGSYCIALSVAWDDVGRPERHVHTTLRDMDAQAIPWIVDQLKQLDHSEKQRDNLDFVHKAIRPQNYDASATGQGPEGPTIIVEDEPLYDMHHLAFVVVDIIFKEKNIKPGDRKQATQDILLS